MHDSKEKLFSIVTVAGSNAAALMLTAKSLALQQDVPRFEWLVIGASDDETAMVRERFELEPVFIADTDGFYAAMNSGLDRATGRYVWFMAAGDCFPDSFALRAMARDIQGAMGPDFIYGDARESGRILQAQPFHRLTRRLITPLQAMLFRRDMIKALRFDTHYAVAADYAFALQFIGTATRPHDVPRVLCDLVTDAQPDGGQRLRENHAIRRDVLGISPWRNDLILRLDTFVAALRLKYPKIHRRLCQTMQRSTSRALPREKRPLFRRRLRARWDRR